MDKIFKAWSNSLGYHIITLKSLHYHKYDLEAFVTNKFFVGFRYLKDNKNKVVVSIILDDKFWNDCFVVMKLGSICMLITHC